MPKRGLRDFYIETILEKSTDGHYCVNDRQAVVKQLNKEGCFPVSNSDNFQTRINSTWNNKSQPNPKSCSTSSNISSEDTARNLYKNINESKAKSQEQECKTPNGKRPIFSLNEQQKSGNRENLFTSKEATNFRCVPSESSVIKQQSLHLLKLPAWIHCTRYSDRPCSGPRSRKRRRKHVNAAEERKPRVVFTAGQLQLLNREFEKCPYLSEERRETLAEDLNLTLSQVKVWFQNRRAKLKKSCGVTNQLAHELKEQGLYDH